MRCANCGAELDSNEECSNCHSNNAEIKVLSPEEKRNFQGITIDQSGQNSAEESYQQGARDRIYVRQASFSLPKTGFFVKLLIGAGLLVLAMAIFGTIGFFVLIGSVVWFVLRLFR
ncbi:MAG: hypothetical protein LLG02_06725 [Pelosinus sp.]|nr:hypothetical protein [Pelosinus sp.]